MTGSEFARAAADSDRALNAALLVPPAILGARTPRTALQTWVWRNLRIWLP